MVTQLTIKNYRCFVSPVTVDLVKGLTCFVGVNNAGKSTFMRFLLEMRPLFQLMGQPGAFLASLTGMATFNPSHVTDAQEVFSNLNESGFEVSLTFDAESAHPEMKRVTKAVVTVDRNFRWQTAIYTAGGPVSIRGLAGVGFRDNSKLFQENNLIADFAEITDIAGTYANTLYIGPFRNTINIGTNGKYLDIQIGDAFIKRFRQLKTGPSKKSNTEIQALIESIRKIFEFDTLDISTSADDTSLHINVNGKPYKQHELGSGLAQFIIVLANASILRPKIILIDEPEMNLHPRLQLDFLTTLASYAEESVWFSTHSLGLARSTADRVYSVIRRGDGDSVVRPLAGTPRLTEFLGEMSFSSHKELGFDKILLVEGSTEVKVIQQFLRGMSKDHKIVLLPLGGHMPDAEELEELMRITTEVAALIDSERPCMGAALESRRREFLDICNSRSILAHALDRRATENYFPDKIVKRVFGQKYRGLEPYEKMDDVEPHWSKSQNWKLAAAMSLEEIMDTDLGRFLHEL